MTFICTAAGLSDRLTRQIHFKKIRITRKQWKMAEIQQRCNKYPKSTQGEASPQTSALHQDELLVRLSAWIYSYPSLFDWVNTTCLHSSVLHNLYMLYYNLQTDTKVRLSILALTQTCLLRAWTIDPRPRALCGEAPTQDDTGEVVMRSQPWGRMSDR